MRDFKAFSFSNVKALSNGRIIVGFAAIHGNVDSWDDRSWPGAFAKTLAENRSRVKHLWNHDSETPPIASITEIKEVGAEEIPAEILAKFPAGTITGGLMVTREYYDNDLGNWVLEGIQKGDITEMSYAFGVVKCDFTDEEIPTGGTRRIRELREMKLYDTSDVLWGMNSATLASAKSGAKLQPLGYLYQQIELHLKEKKAGRRNSTSDQALIDQMHKNLVELGAVCDPQADPEDPAKSNEPEEKEAEAAAGSTSLNSNWILLQKAKSINSGVK